MHILLSNDDGYQAPGILALQQALRAMPGVRVSSVAPAENASGTSSSLSLHRPLAVTQLAVDTCYVNGTPADCVHLAMTALLDSKPDLLLSGINNGANLGDDVIYSGTVAAAIEGHLFGLPAIAFSQVEKGWKHLDAAVEQALKMVALWQEKGRPPVLWNVNVPNRPSAELKPLLVRRLGKRHSSQPAIEQINPRGEKMYWIGPAGAAQADGGDTDFAASAAGHVCLTPLSLDLTDYNALAQLGA